MTSAFSKHARASMRLAAPLRRPLLSDIRDQADHCARAGTRIARSAHRSVSFVFHLLLSIWRPLLIKRPRCLRQSLVSLLIVVTASQQSLALSSPAARNGISKPETAFYEAVYSGWAGFLESSLPVIENAAAGVRNILR
jgi:hypothetical protein